MIPRITDNDSISQALWKITRRHGVASAVVAILAAIYYSTVGRDSR